MLRYEYKYIIPLYQLDTLRRLILPFMELDGHAGAERGEYTVRSIYFDTPGLQCFFDKKDGVKRRNKVRLRGYDDGGEGEAVFFEIKEKMDDPLWKSRASMAYWQAKRVLGLGETLERYLPPDASPKTDENARRFLYHLHARRMHPVVNVIYEREPYQPVLKDKDNNLRITFDKNLRAVAYPSLNSLYLEDGAKTVLPAHFIMEVKFNHYFPSWLKPVVARLRLRKGSASKYAMAIERLRVASGQPWN